MPNTDLHDLPAALGGTPTFESAPDASYPKLEGWRQISEAEAKIAYEMTLRNELSGASPVVQAFEQMWRDRHDTKFAITLNSGTAAIHSAMFGLGVGPGDEVICPTYTWICSITPALMLMAKPVFCEIDPRTLLIDVEDVRRRITERTKAIVAVHLWGNVCDMDALMALSDETGVPVIEDCSHAHGASYKGVPCGSIGHVAAWSLQGSKPVSAGEGGVLATDDAEIFERACLLGQVNRSVKIEGGNPRYKHLPPMGLGVKYRAHPVAIGIASVQMEKLEALNAKRSSFIREVSDGLRTIPGVSPVETYPAHSLRVSSDSLSTTPRKSCAVCRRPCLPMRSERRACSRTTTRIRSSSVTACRYFRVAPRRTTTRIRFSTPCHCLRRGWTSIPKDGDPSVRPKWGEITQATPKATCPSVKKPVHASCSCLS